MPAPTRITDFSATASSNSPSGSEAIGTSLDDYLRAIQATVRGDLATKGADIASASTTDLGAVSGLAHDITGTTTITSFGTVAAGVWKIIKFEGALTLTHNATSLILPGGANITTADGDVALMFSEGGGNWRCLSYTKVSDWGAWTASTPTPTATAGSFTSVSCSARHKQVGKIVYYSGRVVITTNGTAAASVIVPLPVQSFSGAYVGSMRESASAGFTGAAHIIPALSTTQLYLLRYDGTYPGASGYSLDFTIVYEAA